MFIFKAQNPELENCVKELCSIKTFENNSGWEVKVGKDEARRLIMYGFSQKKVYTGIQVANRNYEDDRRRERNRDRE